MTAIWTIGVVLHLGAVLSVVAAEPQTELLAAYVPPSLILETHPSPPTLPEWELLSETSHWRLTPPRTRLASHMTRWARFEDEYGIREREPSAFKASLQTAKYQLDKTVFALDDFVANLEDALKIEYRLSSAGTGTPPRAYRDPWRDAWENATLKSDVDLNVFSGRAFIGLRLVFPIGD